MVPLQDNDLVLFLDQESLLGLYLKSWGLDVVVKNSYFPLKIIIFLLQGLLLFGHIVRHLCEDWRVADELPLFDDHRWFGAVVGRYHGRDVRRPLHWGMIVLNNWWWRALHVRLWLDPTVSKHRVSIHIVPGVVVATLLFQLKSVNHRSVCFLDTLFSFRSLMELNCQEFDLLLKYSLLLNELGLFISILLLQDGDLFANVVFAVYRDQVVKSIHRLSDITLVYSSSPEFIGEAQVDPRSSHCAVMQYIVSTVWYRSCQVFPWLLCVWVLIWNLTDPVSAQP